VKYAAQTRHMAPAAQPVEPSNEEQNIAMSGSTDGDEVAMTPRASVNKRRKMVGDISSTPTPSSGTSPESRVVSYRVWMKRHGGIWGKDAMRRCHWKSGFLLGMIPDCDVCKQLAETWCVQTISGQAVSNAASSGQAVLQAASIGQASSGQALQAASSGQALQRPADEIVQRGGGESDAGQIVAQNRESMYMTLQAYLNQHPSTFERCPAGTVRMIA